MVASNEFCDPIDRMFPIASPCSVSWDSMSGDDRVRTCKNCATKVFNISELTKEEARLLAASNTAHLCVRIEVARSGTVITKKPKANRQRRVSLAHRWLSFISAVMFGTFLAGCREKTMDTPKEPQTAGDSEHTDDRSTYTLMGTVTPRIIIPEEEEERVPPNSDRQ